MNPRKKSEPHLLQSDCWKAEASRGKQGRSRNQLAFNPPGTQLRARRALSGVKQVSCLGVWSCPIILFFVLTLWCFTPCRCESESVCVCVRVCLWVFGRVRTRMRVLLNLLN